MRRSTWDGNRSKGRQKRDGYGKKQTKVSLSGGIETDKKQIICIGALVSLAQSDQVSILLNY